MGSSSRKGGGQSAQPNPNYDQGMQNNPAYQRAQADYNAKLQSMRAPTTTVGSAPGAIATSGYMGAGTDGGPPLPGAMQMPLPPNPANYNQGRNALAQLAMTFGPNSMPRGLGLPSRYTYQGGRGGSG